MKAIMCNICFALESLLGLVGFNTLGILKHNSESWYNVTNGAMNVTLLQVKTYY